jgi:UDP-N-acetylmuramate dehydrogenase
VVNDLVTLQTALTWAQSAQIPWFVLGGGSNLLVADAGFDGLVLHLTHQGQQVTTKAEANSRQVLVTVAAGEDWDPLVAHTVKANWQGLECLSGIPGKVGATPIQNVGAYGQEVSETIVKVVVYDVTCKQLRSLSNADCQFGYRHSIFKTKNLQQQTSQIVWAVTYCLTVDAPPAVRYPELARYFTTQESQSTVSLATVREAVLHLRRQKSMVLDPRDINSRSAGSFFVNPIISPAMLQALQTRLTATQREQLPQFPTPDGQVKLSAAWLIEQAGFSKGYQKSTVGLSANHALAVVNYDHATAAQVLAFAELIKSVVYQKWQISLAMEPVYLK